MAPYSRTRRGLSPVGWGIVLLGVAILPLIAIFLVNVMFGTQIPFTTTTYILTFVVFLVVFFVLGVVLTLAGRAR